MSRSQALKEAQKRYEENKKKQGIKDSKSYLMKCHLENDSDVIEFMEQEKNKSGLLKKLIRNHIKSKQ